MIERLLITLITAALAVTAYLLLAAYQRRRVTAAAQTMVKPGQARVLYFYSGMCSACRAQAHYLAQLDEPHQALIEPVEVEQAPELARQFNILTLPTTILIDREGNVRYINPGLANPFKLARQVEELINPDP